MEIGYWHWKSLKSKGFGRSILRIFIIEIPRNRKLNNGKTAGKDKLTGEIKVGVTGWWTGFGGYVL